MAAYEYAVKGLCKVPAQKVGELMEKLERSKNGLSPSSLLEASRKDGTLLHEYFDWDDTSAAEKWRLSQAQGLILNVRVVIKETDSDHEIKERGFVATPDRKSAYVSLQTAFSNEEWKKSLLNQVKTDMETFIAKYRRLQEVQSVIAQMELVKESL
jgi:hypothetical protein